MRDGDIISEYDHLAECHRISLEKAARSESSEVWNNLCNIYFGNVSSEKKALLRNHIRQK
jgi:hypothetical protein